MNELERLRNLGVQLVEQESKLPVIETAQSILEKELAQFLKLSNRFDTLNVIPSQKLELVNRLMTKFDDLWTKYNTKASFLEFLDKNNITTKERVQTCITTLNDNLNRPEVDLRTYTNTEILIASFLLVNTNGNQITQRDRIGESNFCWRFGIPIKVGGKEVIDKNELHMRVATSDLLSNSAFNAQVMKQVNCSKEDAYSFIQALRQRINVAFGVDVAELKQDLVNKSKESTNYQAMINGELAVLNLILMAYTDKTRLYAADLPHNKVPHIHLEQTPPSGKRYNLHIPLSHGQPKNDQKSLVK